MSANLILVVDDDPQIRALLQDYLGRNGFQVRLAASAEAMRAALRREPPDLLLLDLGLPDGDGLELTREVRAATDLPIIMITGRGDPVDRVIGLEVGADDYLVKPFVERELLARIRSVLRRYQRADTAHPPRQGGQPVVEFDGWRLDTERYRLTDPDDRPVELTSHEFQLLDILVHHAHRVLSRERILSLSADREWLPYDRSVDVAIGKLRRKLGEDPAAPRLIKTVRGVGYVFSGHVSDGEP